MNRKLKRTLVNGARKEIKKKTKELIKFNLGKDRDKEIERRRINETCANVFLQWQKDFINTPKTADSIPDALNDLSAKLYTAIGAQSEEGATILKYVWEELIMPAIAKSHDLASLVNSTTVDVRADCACGRIFITPVIRRMFLARAFDIECDACGYTIPGKDCNLAKRGTK